MSLPWAALLKRLSIRLQPHGPSHLIRSQWKPVAPCHHSYSTGPGCNCDSHRSTALDTLRKPFRCKREDIMWLMYNSVSHGWHCTWLERRDRERDTWKSRVLFTFFIGYIQSWKPHPRFYQSNWQPIHLNYTWMRMRTITALQKLESLTLLRVCLSPSFTRSVSLPLPYHLSSFLFHLCWYLHVNDFCVSAFLVSFSLSFFCLLFTCQWLSLLDGWNESNLLCDSQAILPAITLIHSGQWILMTVKPGSCEEILQALALVTLVWLSRVGALCHFHLWRCFLMICDVLTLFLFQTFAAQGTHFDLFWELLLCTDSNTRRTVILETACCLLFQTHLVTAALSQAWHSIWTPQQCESHYTSRKLLWIVDTSTHTKSNFSMGSRYFPVRAWR